MDAEADNYKFINTVTDLNIANTIQHIYHESNILKIMIDQGEIGLVGALYDVTTGEVSFKDFSQTVSLFEKNTSQKLLENLQQMIKPENVEVTS